MFRKFTMGKHSLVDRYDNGWRFVDFYSFDRLVIGGISYSIGRQCTSTKFGDTARGRVIGLERYLLMVACLRLSVASTAVLRIEDLRPSSSTQITYKIQLLLVVVSVMRSNREAERCVRPGKKVFIISLVKEVETT